MATTVRRCRAFEMKRGDSFIVPRDRRRVAVGLRWAAALEDGSPLDFDVVGSCTLLDAQGNLISTLSDHHTADDRAGGSTAITFMSDPMFDLPARKRTEDDYSVVWMGGDDSAVLLDLSKVPDTVNEIVFVLTMRLEDLESFGQLSYVGCRLFDDPRFNQDNGCGSNELCVFEVICSQLYGSNAVYLSRLERVPRGKKQPQSQQAEQQEQKSDLQPPPSVHGKDPVEQTSSSSKSDRLDSTSQRKKKHSFDLSIDERSHQSKSSSSSAVSSTTAVVTTDGSTVRDCCKCAFGNEDDWRFVTVAEAIEGSTPAFAAYAVSLRASPDVSRRQLIYKLGGAAEAERSEDEKDMTDYNGRNVKAPSRHERLFYQSDKRAREAENDHYAGFVEYAIMKTIKSSCTSQPHPPESTTTHKRTLVAPPRLNPTRAGVGSPVQPRTRMRKQRKSRNCVVM